MTGELGANASRDQKGAPDGHPNHISNPRGGDGGEPTDTGVNARVAILDRWRQHRADRKRLVLVRWLRRTANRAPDTDPIRRSREALLHYRAAAVRTDLLEIAASPERKRTPDPASVATLHKLLTNGCDSPLYNPNIHVSELRAMLEQVRAGFLTRL